MLEKIEKIFFFLIILGQILAYGAVIYLEKLTHSSAGVNHHLYYQKTQYMDSIFIDANLQIIAVVSCALIAISLVNIIIAIKSSKRYLLVGSTVSFFWNVLLEIALFSNSFKEKLNYPYLLMVLISIVLSALICMFIANRIKSNVY